MIVDIPSVLAYVFGLLFLLAVGWLFLRPFQWVLRLLLSSVLGGIMLFAFNLLCGFAGLSIAVNPLSAAIAGVLGVPGVVLLLLMQFML